MAKAILQSVRAQQNQVLRYLISTSREKTARDLGVAPSTLERYLRADPKSIRRKPEHYSKKLQSADIKQIAQEHDTRLVPRLYGKKLAKKLKHVNESQYNLRVVRYNRAVTQKRRTPQISQQGLPEIRYFGYQPAVYEKEHIREQALINLAGYNKRLILAEYHAGKLTKDESVTMLKSLYATSDYTYTSEMESMDFE